MNPLASHRPSCRSQTRSVAAAEWFLWDPDAESPLPVLIDDNATPILCGGDDMRVLALVAQLIKREYLHFLFCTMCCHDRKHSTWRSDKARLAICAREDLLGASCSIRDRCSSHGTRGSSVRSLTHVMLHPRSELHRVTSVAASGLAQPPWPLVVPAPGPC